MTPWQRWKQTSLPNQLLVIASILMACGTLFYGFVASLQYRMMQNQLAAIREQSGLMQKSLENVRDQTNSSTYLTMRNRYFGVWSKLPEHYENLQVTRKKYKNFQLFKSYWYISFDEWYVTQKIGAFKDLWAGYYEYAYLRSLNKRSMRVSLCLLKDQEFKDGVGREFVQAIENLYSRTHNGQSLWAEQLVGPECGERVSQVD
jgi:hypothetical protein